jgi:hypothetical protein
MALSRIQSSTSLIATAHRQGDTQTCSCRLCAGGEHFGIPGWDSSGAAVHLVRVISIPLLSRLTVRCSEIHRPVQSSWCWPPPLPLTASSAPLLR